MTEPQHSAEMSGMPAASHVAVADAKFPMVSAGKGSPILFVHGAWADLRIWCGLWAAIAKRHEFLAVTQRHFGCHAWPQAKPFSRDVHTDDLIALIKAMNKAVHLVGWSYAGAILLRTAYKIPEFVKSLVIYEPSFESEVPQPGRHDLRHAREIFWNELEPAYAVARSGDLHQAMQLGVEIVFGLKRGDFAKLDPNFRQVFLDNAHTMMPDLEAPAPEPLSEMELRTIACPVLIACGEQTHRQYRLMAESTLNKLPNGSVRRFQDVGHGGPVQMPNQFGDVVLDFVDSLPAPARSPASRR